MSDRRKSVQPQHRVSRVTPVKLVNVPASKITDRPPTSAKSHVKRPEPEPNPELYPVVVEDKTSLHEATNDREKLTECIMNLAVSIRKRLDAMTTKFPMRMTLMNKLTSSKRWDSFPVKLPDEFVCWTDVPVADIELYILKAILDNVDEDQSYTWLKIRVSLSEFITRDVKTIVDAIDKQCSDPKRRLRNKRRKIQKRKRESLLAKESTSNNPIAEPGAPILPKPHSAVIGYHPLEQGRISEKHDAVERANPFLISNQKPPNRVSPKKRFCATSQRRPGPKSKTGVNVVPDQNDSDSDDEVLILDEVPAKR